MIQIFSKKYPKVLLHQINRLNEISGRNNISDDKEFLQIATLKMKEGDTFKPHQHIWKEPTYKLFLAQESWIVIKGKVKVSYYDVDGTFLISHEIYQGDCSVTYEGGHTYDILEDDTIVYEFKIGPYTGIENDKVFIDE